MKFCLRSRLSPRFLSQADEIRVDYRDRATIPDLYEKYKGKTIILFPPNYNDDPYDWDQITMFNLLCEKNFILNCPNISIAVMAKEHEIRFMLDKEISTYWELSGLEELGAEYAYVGIPLFFDLDGTLIDVKGAQKKAVNHLYNLYDFKEKVGFDECRFEKLIKELSNTDQYMPLDMEYTKKEVFHQSF